MTTTETKLTPAERSAETLASARETLQDRAADLESIETEIGSVKLAWTAGDDTIPASRLTELQAEETRLAALVAAAERKFKSAKRGLRTDDPELAEAVAYALGTSVHGFEAEPVTELPSIEDSSEKPRLFVVQSKQHHSPGDGTVSGECVIHLTGPDWMKPMNPKAVQSTLHKSGIRFDHDLTLSGNMINIQAKFARPKVPTIRSIPDEKGARVGVDLSTLIERGTNDERRGPLVIVHDTSGEVVQVRNEDGIRHSEFEIGVTISNNPHGYWSADEAVDHTQKILAALKGDCLGVLGRVTEVEHVSVAPTEAGIMGTRGRQIVTRFSTISKVGK